MQYYFELFLFTGIDVCNRIKMLEKLIRKLSNRLQSQLVNKKISVETVLESLTLLPIELKMEYDSSIQEKLPQVERAGTIPELFHRLNPLFTFIDYSLLHYLISEFGNFELKNDMVSYVKGIEIFMRETTVGDVINHWSGGKIASEHFSELWIKISDDPKTYTLENLNKLRKKLCSIIKLSEVLINIVRMVPASSFFAVWQVPTVAVPELTEAINHVDKTFYKTEHVLMILLDKKLLYQADVNDKVKQLYK